jgi:CheY-like chemotaxis protein
VDDDSEVRQALERCLSSRYQVALASGTEEALAIAAEEGGFDIVLCDLMMADGGGRRVYEALTARSPALAARLVFLTGGATTAEARDFLSAQKQPVLHKPLDLEALARLAEDLANGAGGSSASPTGL